MITEKIYSITNNDGKFIEIVNYEDEKKVCDIIKKENSKQNTLTIHTIDVNRFHEKGTIITDNLSDDIIICSDKHEAKKVTKILNNINIEKERAEAKIRALTI